MANPKVWLAEFQYVNNGVDPPGYHACLGVITDDGLGGEHKRTTDPMPPGLAAEKGFTLDVIAKAINQAVMEDRDAKSAELAVLKAERKADAQAMKALKKERDDLEKAGITAVAQRDTLKRERDVLRATREAQRARDEAKDQELAAQRATIGELNVSLAMGKRK
jgi:hypothetical protein